MSQNKFAKLQEKIANGQKKGTIYDAALTLQRAEETVTRIPSGFAPELSRPNLADIGHSVSNAASAFTGENGAVAQRGLEPYFEKVPYAMIDPNPFNARQTYSPLRINKMATEIAADGQLMPGVATKRNGRYVLAAGHYRWKGIGVSGINYMDLMIHENLSDQDLYKISYKENAERTEQSALDNALSWRLLIDDKVYESETQIAEITGISLSTINKTLSILKLPHSVLEFIKENDVTKFGFSPLYELVQYNKVSDEMHTLQIAEKILNEEFSRNDIIAARLLLEKPKNPRKTKENSRGYKIYNANDVETGFIKDFGSGKIQLEINIEDDDERKKILEELKLKFDVK